MFSQTIEREPLPQIHRTIAAAKLAGTDVDHAESKQCSWPYPCNEVWFDNQWSGCSAPCRPPVDTAKAVGMPSATLGPHTLLASTTHRAKLLLWVRLRIKYCHKVERAHMHSVPSLLFFACTVLGPSLCLPPNTTRSHTQYYNLSCLTRAHPHPSPHGARAPGRPG